MLGTIRRRIPASLSHLLLSRAVDQGAMAAASLVLARAVGPEEFAPIAVLLVVNSLAVQVSDFGLGFAVMRSRPGEPIARRSLHRLRALSLSIALCGSAVGVALGGRFGLILAAGAWIWAASSEAYVRKSSALRLGASVQVATAEVLGSIVVAATVAAVWTFDLSVVWFAAALVAKHVVEILGVRTWKECFAPGADPARSGPEWLGQVMSYAVANVDYLVVGLVLSPAEFSSYVIAFRMASALPALMANPITNTAFVELADATSEERLEARARVLRRARWSGVAGGFLVLVLAPLLPLLLGGQWSGTGWLVAVLAPAVPFRLLLGTAVASVITLGQARRIVKWEAARLVAVGMAALIGSVAGLVPATALVSMATILSLDQIHRWSARAGGEEPPARETVFAALSCVLVVLFAVAGYRALS